MTLALIVPYCHLTLLAVGLAVGVLGLKATEKYVPPRSFKKYFLLVMLALIAADALAGWTWWDAVGTRIMDLSQ